MDFSELIKQRYYVRKFSSRNVEQEKLDIILEAGRLAPTAKNQQPQRIYVLRSPEAIEKANIVSPCIYGATTVLLICGDTENCWRRPDTGTPGAETDCAIVCTHMMLQAQQLGIGSVMVGMFDSEKARKEFNIPEGTVPYLMLPLGYADMGPSERHTDRKPLDQTTIIL